MVKLTNEQIEKQKEIKRIIRYWEGKKRYAQMRIDENTKKYADITSKALDKNEQYRTQAQAEPGLHPQADPRRTQAHAQA